MKGKWGAVDCRGKLVILMIYEDMRDFSEGLVAAKSVRSWGFLDQSGKSVIPFAYRSAEPFREGLALVAAAPDDGADTKRYGYISREGLVVVSLTHLSAESFSEGLAQIAEDNKAWFIDHGGKTLFELPRGGLEIPKEAER